MLLSFATYAELSLKAINLLALINFKIFCNFSSIIRKSQGSQKHKDFDVINLEEIKRDRKKFFVINLVKLHQQLFLDDAGFLFLGYLMRRLSY